MQLRLKMGNSKDVIDVLTQNSVFCPNSGYFRLLYKESSFKIFDYLYLQF